MEYWGRKRYEISSNKRLDYFKMITVSFIFLLFFFSILIELLLGSLGIILPLTALCIFYLSMVYGWQAGLIFGAGTGLIIDLLYGRELLISPFSMMSVTAITIFWLHKGETKTFLLHMFPGFLTALSYTLPSLISGGFSSGINIYSLYDNIFLLFSSMLSGALILPPLIQILDYLSKQLGLELYSSARERIGEGSSGWR